MGINHKILLHQKRDHFGFDVYDPVFYQAWDSGIFLEIK